MYEEAKSREMFARLLKTIRTALGLTQVQMAEHLGVSRVRYNQYEGRYHLPKQPERFLEAIAALVTERISSASREPTRTCRKKRTLKPAARNGQSA